MNPAPDQPRAPVTEPGGKSPGPSSDGHPIRSFIAIVATAAIVLLAMAWTGASNPRLWSPGGGGWNKGPRPYERIDIRNDGAVPVRIQGVTLRPGPNETALPVLTGPGPDRPELIEPTPFEPFTLGGGETWSFYVAGAKYCEAGKTSALVTFATLDLEVRAPAGWRRHRTFDSGAMSQGQTFSCP